jgi:hypothetical protein
MTNSSKKTTAASKQAVKTSKSAKPETVEKRKTSPAKAPVKAAAKTAAPTKTTPKAPAKNTAKPAKPAAAKPADAAPAPAKAAPAKRASAKPKTAAKKTTIGVESDIGFGNHLFLRGEGPGLSWDVGTPMTCKNSSHWEWTTDSTKKTLVFKILINDQVWSQGENFEVQPGEEKVLQPEF